MATKEPIDSDVEVDAAPAAQGAPELLSDVAETIAANAIKTAKSSADRYIDGHKVDPNLAKKGPRNHGSPLIQQRRTDVEPREHGVDETFKGKDKAFEKTFEDFAIRNDGSEFSNMDAGGKSSSTGSSVYLDSDNDDGYHASNSKSQALPQTESWLGLAERAMGGDGDPYTSDLAFSYSPMNFDHNPYSSTNYNVATDYNVLSQARYDDGILMIGNSCAVVGGPLELAAREAVANVNAWKTDSALIQRAQQAFVDEETGKVYVDGKELDPATDPEAQRIIAAKIGMATEPEKAAPMAFKPKAELDEMAKANPTFKMPEILKQNYAGAAPDNLALKTSPVNTISGIGQAGDLGFTYQSIDEITASVTKGNGLGAKTTPTIDLAGGLDGQKLKPMGPTAPAPAPAVAGPAPV